MTSAIYFVKHYTSTQVEPMALPVFYFVHLAYILNCATDPKNVVRFLFP